MIYANKTVWREGMFLQPQHFQQNDRYQHMQLANLVKTVSPYYYGFDDLVINKQFLEQGKVVLDSVQAVFQDGSFYNAPGIDALPDALDLPIGARDVTVYLGLYDQRLIAKDIEAGTDNRTLTQVIQCPDDISENHIKADVEVSHLKPKLLTDQYEAANYCLLPIAKIKEVRPDKKIYLDDSFIESRISINKQPLLVKSIEDVLGLVIFRAEVLSKRINQGDQSESVRVSDFMMLELMNLYLVKLRHLLAKPAINCLESYEMLAELLAQLATYTDQSRVLNQTYAYDHHKPHQTFMPLFDQLRKSLHLVLEQQAKAFSIDEHSNGLFVIDNLQESLFEEGSIILGVYANVPQEELRNELPNQIKIAPLGQIKDMVSKGVSGLPIQSLPTAPRQIPYHANFIYFDVGLDHEIWQQVVETNSLAIHIGAAYQDLQVSLWSVHS